MVLIFVSLALVSCGRTVKTRYEAYNKQSDATKSQIVTANGGKYNYDLTEYVIMPEYKGIEIPDVTYTASDEDVAKKRYEKLAYFADEYVVDDGTVEEYDLVVADYTCTVNGLLYSDLCSQGNTSLRNFMVGVNKFGVPEIDKAIIGMAPGETKTITFTFPTPYYKSVVLSGKEGEFTVTVESIRRQIFDDYTDDFISEHYGDATVEQYDATIVEQLEHDTAIGLEDYEIDMVWEYFSGNITLKTIPQKEYAEKIDNLMDTYELLAESADMTVDEYATEGLGYESVGAFRNALDEYVVRDIKETIAAHYIARCENIYVTDDEYTSALLENAYEYGTEDISYCEALAIDTYGSLANFREYLMVQKVDNYLVNHSIKIDTNEYFEKKANGEYLYKPSVFSQITAVDVVVIVGIVIAVILVILVAVLAVVAVKAKKDRDKRVAEKVALEEKRRLRREAKKAKKKHHN